MRPRREMPDWSRWGTARLRAAGRGPGTGDAGRPLFDRLRAAGRTCDLGDGTLWLAEELACSHPQASRVDRDTISLLIVCALAAARQGSTRLPLSALGQFLGPIAAAAELQRPVPELAREVAQAAARAASEESGLVGGPGDYRPLVLDGDSIYVQRHHAREKRLAEALSRRAAASANGAGAADAIADVRARPACPGGVPQLLSDEQVRALEAAAAQPFTAIAGGPGTGKTAIIVALLRALARAGTPPEAMALCAPTGKAAQRMAESIRAGLSGIADPAPADRELAAAPPQPRTLHRLLGYQPAADRFRHHENYPLPADVVIADEASMIDLALAERLFRAARPDAKLILFGDADQLPSVDAGAVFRDLVMAGEAAGTARRLSRSYRMDPADPAGRAILVAARAVGRGEAGALLDPSAEASAPLRADPADLAFEGVELFDTGGAPSRLRAFLDDWHRRFVVPDRRLLAIANETYRASGGRLSERDREAIEALLAHHAKRRLLTVTRQLSTGAEAINAYFHDRALDATQLHMRPDFVPGEPILMRKNDYRRQLFNGDQGVVLRVAGDGQPQRFCAVFPGPDGFAAYPIDALRAEIELAYALTVHKAQGSEHDAVALLLPHAEQPLLSRELVYTALTRARRAAVIAGPRRLIARASRSAPRFTRLAPLEPA